MELSQLFDSSEVLLNFVLQHVVFVGDLNTVTEDRSHCVTLKVTLNVTEAKLGRLYIHVLWLIIHKRYTFCQTNISMEYIYEII